MLKIETHMRSTLLVQMGNCMPKEDPRPKHLHGCNGWAAQADFLVNNKKIQATRLQNALHRKMGFHMMHSALLVRSVVAAQNLRESCPHACTPTQYHGTSSARTLRERNGSAAARFGRSMDECSPWTLVANFQNLHKTHTHKNTIQKSTDTHT